jgi:hypothetical protein
MWPQVGDFGWPSGFIRTERIRIISWYGKIKIEYKDVLERGNNFIFAEFEGNTGTGTLQIILVIIAWHNDRFVPVLAETLSYYNSCCDIGDLQELKMSYKFTHRDSKPPSIHLDFKYIETYSHGPYANLNGTWSEDLVWNEQSFSFYHEKSIQEMLDASFYAQKNIAKVRSTFMKVSLDGFCNDLIRDINIMGILSPSPK